VPELKETERAVLDRYRINGKRHTYVLGQNTGVVSFYSQQCRAFQLARVFVASLSPDEIKNHKFAVIGGGVGGVTLWAALRSFGLQKVALYEATSEILSRQMDAKHRHAHPALNDWPRLSGARVFSSTTKWPFLNWFGADAASVVEQLRDDPILNQLQNAPDATILKDYQALSVREIHGGPGRDRGNVRVGFDTPDGQWNDTVHSVFMTVGYGYERDLKHSNCNSYWWPDNIRQFVRDRHEYGDFKFVISGTGDGALIDAIRLAVKLLIST
jgi:hypothetical protein